MTNRFITAGILIFIGCFVITKGGYWLWVWTLFVSLVVAYELICILRKNKINPYASIVYSSITLGMLSLLFMPTRMLWSSWWMKMIVLGIIGLSFFELSTRKLYGFSNRWLSTLKLSIFCLTTLPFISLLRDSHNGHWMMLFCFMIIWSTDTWALFGGRWIGRTPLSTISPQKTVEGSLVGLIMSLILVCIYIVLRGVPFWPYFIAGILISVVSQMGDLHESLVKRILKVKDSSQLLPGHGGFYDRADSTLFVMPLVYYFFL